MFDNIKYDIVFSARKTFAIEVHADLKIIVRAPKKMRQAEINAHIAHRMQWIHKKLDYFRKHPVLTPSRRYVNGETHLYLGKHYPLHITLGNLNAIELRHGHFEIVCDQVATPHLVKHLLHKWYLEHSKAIFERILIESFPQFKRMGYAMPRLRIRHMKTRWGSFAHHGVMTLNSDLIRAPMTCVEYVIFHELCHLKYKGHGKRFYSLMDKVLPDWKERRQALRHITP